MPTFELPKFTMPKLPFELPTFEMPTFEMPTFEMPTFEMPTFEMPELPELPSAEQVIGAVRDAAYIGVGLAAMTAERVQAFQRQAVELVTEQVAKLRAAAN
jgi:hypothetical protein